MHECPTLHSALPSLFAGLVPDRPVLWAVLRNRHAGQAWVDRTEAPTQCILRTDTTLTFVSRRASQAFLDAALAQAKQIGSVGLIWSAELYPRLRPPKPAHTGQRLGFSGIDPHSRVLVDLRRRVPDGHLIRPIDRTLLRRCEWRSDMAFFCGSQENFLVNGLGLCLMRGDDIIVEAYASSLGETHAEIGAITRERYRGRGYAAIACAHLIDTLGRRASHHPT